MEKVIYLQKIGDLDNIVLKKLKKKLKEIFKDVVDSVEIVSEPIPLIESEFNPSKKQYNASLILRRILKYSKKNNKFRILGIIDKDIYSRSLNFVFGVAIIPKKDSLNSPGACLIQLARLKEGFYDRSEDENKFGTRIFKEAVHELGHTFGLKHCKNKCVMQFSNRLSEADEKPIKFCRNCSEKLRDIINELC